jgi:hypothetical protein
MQVQVHDDVVMASKARGGELAVTWSTVKGRHMLPSVPEVCHIPIQLTLTGKRYSLAAVEAPKDVFASQYGDIEIEASRPQVSCSFCSVEPFENK